VYEDKVEASRREGLSRRGKPNGSSHNFAANSRERTVAARKAPVRGERERERPFRRTAGCGPDVAKKAPPVRSVSGEVLYEPYSPNSLTCAILSYMCHFRSTVLCEPNCLKCAIFARDLMWRRSRLPCGACWAKRWTQRGSAGGRGGRGGVSIGEMGVRASPAGGSVSKY